MPMNLGDERDWALLRKRLFEPRLLLETASVFLTAAIRFIFNRISVSRVILYPPEVKQKLSNIVAPKGELMVCEPLDTGCLPTSLRIITDVMEYESFPNWSKQYSDSEFYLFLHRWNWLLQDIEHRDSQKVFRWGCNMMRSWLRHFGSCPLGMLSESYTVAERISNSLIFSRVLVGDWKALPSDISRAIVRKAEFLSHNLEYQVGKLNGNHLINNARALILAGHATEQREILELGRIVLKKEIDQLIAEGLFLREGSSHYHFLFVRWLLEIRLVSEEAKDFEMASILDLLLPRLLDGAYFFQVLNPEGKAIFPRIGDVSPDCSPEWLEDLLKSPILSLCGRQPIQDERPLTGWAALWKDVCCENSTNKPSTFAFKKEWSFYEEAGWCKLIWRDWTVLWHVEDPSGIPIASHAHRDFCSASVYFKGAEVLIDPGRLSYEMGSFMDCGDKERSHSLPILDGFGPILSKRDRFLPPCYRSARISVDKVVSTDSVTVSLKHDGFLRLANGAGEHIRRFIFFKDYFEIIDDFKGEGVHEFDFFFHFPLQNGKISQSGMDRKNHQVLSTSIQESNEQLENVHITGGKDRAIGWVYPAYGDSELSLTTRSHTKQRLPVSFKHKIIVPEP